MRVFDVGTAPSWLMSLDRWLLWNSENILLGLPAAIALFRGRAVLPKLFLGALQPPYVWVLGIGVGSLAQGYGTLVSLPFYGLPSFDPSGPVSAFGDGPLAAFILGPLEEEFLYQVAIQTGLQRFGVAQAVIGTSLLFVGMHFIGNGVTPYVGFIRLLPSFLAFALIRQVTKSFGVAVIAHTTFNVIGSCLVIGPRL